MDRENPKDLSWLTINAGCVERVRSCVKGQQSDFKL